MSENEEQLCERTAVNIWMEVRALSAAMENPSMFAILRRERILEELERSESILSACITNLRARKTIERNSAIIVDLKERLGK